MTPDEMGENVAAHKATLRQMNTRLGSIDSRLTSIEGRMATKGELRGWGAVLSGLLALATAIMLKYS